MENKLFFRILFYFLSLLLPIIIIGALYYYNYTENLKQDFSDKVQVNLKSSADTIEFYLQTAQETSISFFFDDNVNGKLKPFEQYTQHEKATLLQIPHALSRIRSITTEFVDHIFVYTDAEKVYSSDGIEDYDTFFGRFYRYEKYNSDFWKNKLKSNFLIEILEPTEVFKVDTKQLKVIPFIIRSTVNGNNAIMVTNIPVETISKTLRNNSIFMTTDFVILDNENKLIMSNNKVSPELIKQLNQTFHDKHIKQADLHVNGEDTIVNFVKSENYGWKYYSMTPVYEFKKQAEGLITMLLVICIVLSLIGIIFSFIFTYKLYNPIKKLRDILVTKEDVNALNLGHQQDKKNEFEFIGMGINQLIEDNQKQYLDSALSNLIRGNKIQNEINLEKVIFEKLAFKKSNYMCCNISFEFKERFRTDLQDVDQAIILLKLKNLLWGLLNQNLNTYVLEFDRHFFVCISNTDEHDKDKLRVALNHLTDIFKYDLTYCSITVGIGREYEGLTGITKSHSEALTAIHHKNTSITHQVIDCADLSIRHNYSYTFADENKILNCIKIGNGELLVATIDSILQENWEKGVAYHYINLLLLELYNTGQKFSVERGIDTSPFLTEYEQSMLNSKIDTPFEFQEKKQLLLKFYEKLILNVVSPLDSKSDSVINDITKYIEDRFHDDLYLEKISEEFGFSAKYLSRYYKEKTGVNLTDSIAQVRIIKAKELLRDNQDLQIKVISEQVGIFNRMTFLRLFKKYEGITPNEYRELCKKQSRI